MDKYVNFFFDHLSQFYNYWFLVYSRYCYESFSELNEPIQTYKRSVLQEFTSQPHSCIFQYQQYENIASPINVKELLTYLKTLCHNFWEMDQDDSPVKQMEWFHGQEWDDFTQGIDHRWHYAFFDSKTGKEKKVSWKFWANRAMYVICSK